MLMLATHESRRQRIIRDEFAYPPTSEPKVDDAAFLFGAYLVHDAPYSVTQLLRAIPLAQRGVPIDWADHGLRS
ncbi:hypothetical protein [Nocardia sp. NPDC059239]|uniref:hypothetical protein n=1 Tax=Nocardia sp. NPDC059239 TaxID=3346785 RepID=UPI003698BAA8